jgi:hypothetical protein
MKKLIPLTTILLIITLIVLVLVCIAIPRIEKVKKENAELRNYVKQLEVCLNVKNIELEDCKDELTGANQELENIKINYAADQLFIKELKARFWKTKTYANLAEYMLVERGIEFRQVD